MSRDSRVAVVSCRTARPAGPAWPGPRRAATRKEDVLMSGRGAQPGPAALSGLAPLECRPDKCRTPRPASAGAALAARRPGPLFVVAFVGERPGPLSRIREGPAKMLLSLAGVVVACARCARCTAAPDSWSRACTGHRAAGRRRPCRCVCPTLAAAQRAREFCEKKRDVSCL